MKLTKTQNQILASTSNKKDRKLMNKKFKLDNELLEKIKNPEEITVYNLNWDLLNDPDFIIKFLYPNVIKITKETPNEFCVEITEENKEVLYKVWRDFHKGKVGNLDIGRFLFSNSLFSFCLESDKDYQNSKIVSTEEFLRYIGKDGTAIKFLLNKSLSEKASDVLEELGTEINWKKNPNTYDSEKINIGLMDEIGQFNFNPNKDYFKPIRFSTHEPKRNNSLGEIADKVAELALEKIAKTPDVKPLEFDLPKKEDFNVKDYLCFDLEELFYRVNSGEITIMNLYNILREQKLNENKKSPN